MRSPLRTTFFSAAAAAAAAAVLGLTSVLSLAAAAAEATPTPHYTLLHRILPARSASFPSSSSSSSSPPPPLPAWSTRGEITLEYDVHGLPRGAAFAPLQRAIDVVPPSDGDADTLDAGMHYQLALVRGPASASASSSSPSPLPIQVTSTPACLLDALVPASYAHDVLALTLSRNASNADVLSFSYDVAGVTRRGSGPRHEDICPKKPVQTKGGAAKNREVALKVVLGLVEDVESPRLRPPPPPRSDGSTGAEAPPPEKNFLQKYWYYILPILVLLALPSEAPADSGAPAEGAGAGARRIR